MSRLHSYVSIDQFFEQLGNLSELRATAAGRRVVFSLGLYFLARHANLKLRSAGGLWRNHVAAFTGRIHREPQGREITFTGTRQDSHASRFPHTVRMLRDVRRPAWTTQERSVHRDVRQRGKRQILQRPHNAEKLSGVARRHRRMARVTLRLEGRSRIKGRFCHARRELRFLRAV